MNSMQGGITPHEGRGMLLPLRGSPGAPGGLRRGYGGHRDGYFPQERPRILEGIHLEKDITSTRLETESAPIQGAETRTSPGE